MTSEEPRLQPFTETVSPLPFSSLSALGLVCFGIALSSYMLLYMYNKFLTMTRSALPAVISALKRQ